MNTAAVRMALALALAGGISQSAPAQAPAAGFSLRGYEVGAPLDSCPDNNTMPAPAFLAGATLCRLAGGELGGTNVSWIFLTLWNGRIISLGAMLPERGRHVGLTLVEALTEKYGPPDASKAHIAVYRWRLPGQEMAFDGYSGSLIATDTGAMADLRKTNAKKNSGNL